MTTSIGIGDAAPDFDLPASSHERIQLSDYKGKLLVLYFYPKDDTSGCTKQAIAFTEHLGDFAKLGANIIGISKDSTASHDKFIAKHNLGFKLGADETLETCQAYGVWVEKNMYGRTYMGIERSTFLIGPEGKLLQVWRKVRVKDHVEKVLDAVKQISSRS